MLTSVPLLGTNFPAVYVLYFFEYRYFWLQLFFYCDEFWGEL